MFELLQENNWDCGAENSGHIICRDKHTTGDGIVSALQVLSALASAKTTLKKYTAELTLYPQILINVKTQKGFDFRAHASIQETVTAAEKDLDGSGRVLLRPSGTEPVLRVMVEGKDESRVKQWAERISDCVRAAAT